MPCRSVFEYIQDSNKLEVDNDLVYKLKPKEHVPYAWDNPAQVEKKIRLMSYGHFRDINVMEIGSLPPLMVFFISMLSEAHCIFMTIS